MIIFILIDRNSEKPTSDLVLAYAYTKSTVTDVERDREEELPAEDDVLLENWGNKLEPISKLKSATYSKTRYTKFIAVNTISPRILRFPDGSALSSNTVPPS